MLGYLLEKQPGEVYRLDLVHTGFVMTVETNTFDAVLSAVTRKQILEELQTIRMVRGTESAQFFVDLPFISIPNSTRKNLNWEKLSQASKEISLLLQIFNPMYEKTTDTLSSSSRQHILVQTAHLANESGYHAHPLSAGFSKEAVELLAKRYPKGEVFSEHVTSVFELYARLAIKNKKERDEEISRQTIRAGGMFSVMIRVREGGVPHFSVPGNCACLGANPDEFKYDRDIDSHNLDNALQQMTMLMAVTTFWNKVLRPLTEQ